MPTPEEGDIAARLLRHLPGKLGTLPMRELVESARWFAAERDRVMVRALFHLRVSRSCGFSPAGCRHLRLAKAFLLRLNDLLGPIRDHLDHIGGLRPDQSRALAGEFLRNHRQAKRRAASQAFFHRHPRLRFLRRYFLGRKAVLRWA